MTESPFKGKTGLRRLRFGLIASSSGGATGCSTGSAAASKACGSTTRGLRLRRGLAAATSGAASPGSSD